MNRSLRSQAGQTAAEYLGIVVLIGAIVFALAQTAIGKTISSNISVRICQIAHGGISDVSDRTCGGGAKPHASTPGGPTSGPKWGTGWYPVPGVPWNGSIAFTKGKHLAGGNLDNNAGIYAEATISKSTTPCSLDQNGNPTVTLDIDATVEAGVEGQVSTKNVSVSAKAFAGKSLNYSITTDPAHADDIEAYRNVPQPMDPTTIPAGTTLQLNEDSYKGWGNGVAYGYISANYTSAKGKRASTAIQRTDANHVTVMVGDADLVKRASSMGLDIGVASLGLSSDEEDTSGKTASVTIDISSKAGQQAYVNFLRSGKLPATGTAGTSDPQTAQVSTYSSTDGLGASLGPWSVSKTLSTSNNTQTISTNADGSKHQYDFTQLDSVTVGRDATIYPDGSHGPITRTMRLQGLKDNEAQLLSRMAGGSTDGIKGDQDVTLRWTEPQLLRLRNQAQAMLLTRYQRESGDDIPTDPTKRQQLIDYLSQSDLTGNLAQAKTPDDVINVLLQDVANRGSDNGRGLAIELAEFAGNVQADLPDDDPSAGNSYPTVETAGAKC